MPDAVWLADVIRDAGLVVRPLDGWETRGRTNQGVFAPQAVMWHHTVTSPSSSDALIDRFLSIGRSDLPGPLANYSSNRDGSVSIIAAGVANHAGGGAWRGYSGNRFFLGDEMKNLGSGSPNSKHYEPWVPRQLESARIAADAVLKHIGRDHTWLTFHKSYAPTRKVDPHSLILSNEQTRLALIRLAGEEEDMPTLEQIAELIDQKLQLKVVTDSTGYKYVNSGVVGNTVMRQHINNSGTRYADRINNILDLVRSIRSRVDGLNVDPVDEAALVQAVVNAIEEQGIAQAVANEMDARQRARLAD